MIYSKPRVARIRKTTESTNSSSDKPWKYTLCRLISQSVIVEVNRGNSIQHNLGIIDINNRGSISLRKNNKFMCLIWESHTRRTMSDLFSDSDRVRCSLAQQQQQQQQHLSVAATCMQRNDCPSIVVCDYSFQLQLRPSQRQSATILYEGEFYAKNISEKQ